MLKALAAAAVGLIASVQGTTVTKDNVDAVFQFQSWQQAWGKSYASTAEWDHAFSNFNAARARIAERNANPKDTATYALNKFSDLSPSEFQATYLNYRSTRLPIEVAPQPPRHKAWRRSADIPATFDWRTDGSKGPAVTAVKDQGQCGSCWAFSATEEIESMWFQAGNPIPTLSPQQIVDCDTVDQGCNGGNTETAYQYVTQAGGIDTEASYPYTSGDSGSAGTCSVITSDFAAKVNNYTYAIPPCDDSCDHQDENALRQQLYTVGPLSICVDAAPWQDYSGGIMTGDACPHDVGSLDHCTQLVGFDWTNKYWSVRNSWATSWGENGYIRLSVGENTCGVGDDVTIATVVSMRNKH